MVWAILDCHLPYYLNTLLVAAFIVSVEYYRSYFFLLFLVYSVLPLADQFVEDDHVNPTPQEAEILSKQVRWKFPVYSYVIAEWVALFWALDYINRVEMTTVQMLGFLYGMAHISSIGFLISHELFHKRDMLGKVVGTVSMLNSLYMHFYSEHLQGHHKNLGTPKDPATAKYGQTMYDFALKSMGGSLKLCWKRELAALAKAGRPWWHSSNRMLWCFAIEILFCAAIGWGMGLRSMYFFIVQAFSSSFLLEAINYIRHYGLKRKEIRPGVYEKINIHHSWNAPQWIQNYFLLKLQRHSDHHENSYKPYQVLCSYKDSPSLPCGYAVCIPLSYVPPLWFAIIDPLVQEANDLGKPSDEQFKKSTRLLQTFIGIQAALFVAILVAV